MSQLQVTGEAKIRDIQGPVVANSGVVTALDGAASQYVRGDGTLADFPTSSGGGSSVSYYLNSSVSQGTIGGVAYRELSKDPIIGAGTDIAISTTGYVASYITDANDPDVTIVPGGNFNCEFYFSVNNNTGNPFTYAELYKYDGTTFTLLGSSVGVPEYINQGTIIAPYYFAIPVPTSALALTDRLAIRIYVNVDGRTVTLHTENGHLCQVVTTLSKGMVSLNNLTDQSQFLTTGTAGTNFTIASSGDTHTFNLPIASATNTGKLSSTDWSTFNNKLSTATAAATYVPYTGANANVDLGIYTLTASSLRIYEPSGSSGSLILYTGTIGYNYGVNAISLVSSPTVANTLLISSDVSGVRKIAQIGLGSLTATRTFTLPDLSGTLALLEADNIFTGINSFDNSINYKTGASLANVSGYISQAYAKSGTGAGSTLSLKISDGNSVKAINLDFVGSPATYTYTFPASSGTIALTSNLSSYVPYTGATASVDLGTNTLTALGVIANSFSAIGNINPSGNGGYIFLKQGIAPFTYDTGYNSITANSTRFVLIANVDASNNKSALLELGSLTNNTQRTFTLPDATGTIALTSNLSAYLPLAGGTLTGALSGTSATFSGIVSSIVSSGSTSFRVINADNSRTWSLIPSTNAAESDLWLYYGGTGAGTKVAFSNNGNVLIGSTTDNGSRLQVSGAATFSSSVTSTLSSGVFLNNSSGGTNATQIRVNNTSGDLRMGIESSTGNTIQIGTSAYAAVIGNQANNPLQFTTNGTLRMTITSGGNVGIGTSTFPTSTNRLLFLNAPSGSAAQFLLGENGTSYAYLYGYGGDAGLFTSAAIPLILGTNSTERMRITSGGKVGINSAGNSNTTLTVTGFTTGSSDNAFYVTNSTPSQLFAIRNDGLINAGLQGGSPRNYGVAGYPMVVDSTGALGNSVSTRESKANIEPINNIDFIKDLNPVQFNYRIKDHNKMVFTDEFDEHLSYGFIADEIEIAHKELAFYNDFTGEKKLSGVDYNSMIAILTKAVQEQQKQIDELKALINK